MLPHALLLVLLALAPPVQAGKNAGGALIVHTNDAYQYYRSTCARFETLDSPGSCEAANTQTNKDPNSSALIWLIAAFPQSATPGVSLLSFGLTHNLPIGQGYIHNRRACGPAGTIELPDNGWPDQGGNSVVFGSPIVGDTFFPFYMLEVYGFEGRTIGTGINPTGGYAALVDDSNPPLVDECVRFGHVRWYEPGDNVCPPIEGPWACCLPDGRCEMLFTLECEERDGASLLGNPSCDPPPCAEVPGACCFLDGTCESLTATECAQGGGMHLGALAPCDPNPCAGACCFVDGSCQFLDAAACAQQGGEHQGGETLCDPNPCPPAGACCFLDRTCRVLVPTVCENTGGRFLGVGVPCEPDPCATVGSCCLVEGACAVAFEADCATQGGVFFPDYPMCDPYPCSGACCYTDASCEETDAHTCVHSNGAYQGPDTDCEPNPCVPTATEVRTWGAIKAAYR